VGSQWNLKLQTVVIEVNQTARDFIG
jgi:hypothetical protein